MPIGRSLFWGLGLTAMLAVPARAECFNSCGFGTMIALVVGVGLAVVALVVFLLWKLRLGWTIKWLAAAVALAVAVPPAFLGYIHDRKHRAVESLDFAGPLPRLDERRPLILVYDLSFLNCPAALERYVAAKSWQEVLLVEMCRWRASTSADLSRWPTCRCCVRQCGARPLPRVRRPTVAWARR